MDSFFRDLREDCPRIAISFDRLCENDLRKIASLVSRIEEVLQLGIGHHKENDLMCRCAVLLVNSTNSLVAATQLLRYGFTLQPGILVRTILEQISTVLHLISHPSDLSKILRGSFDLTDTIKSAKEILPIFGRLYGYFSGLHSHISDYHVTVHPLKEYSERSEGLEANLDYLMISVLLIHMTAELRFFDQVKITYYWKHVGHGKFQYQPSTEAQAWIDDMAGHMLRGTTPSKLQP